MTTDRAIRASDHDREHLVEILRSQYAEGRLTLEEFNERMAAAYAAKTWGDLLDLTKDLPADVRLGADLPAAQAGQRARQPQPAGPRGLAPLRFLPLVPLLLAGLVLASITWGAVGYDGHHHHYFSFFPIWLLVMVIFFLRRSLYRGGRGRRGPFR